MDEQIVRFYDQFASDYHLIMADWEQTVRQQGVVLDRLIVADFRLLPTQVVGHFDVVLSCDNAVAHLLGEADLHRAARSMWSTVAPSAPLLLSLRDYDALLDEQPRATPVRVFDSPAGPRAVFQVWDWAPSTRARGRAADTPPEV